MRRGLFKQINYLIAKAIHTYDMIKEGDKILVAVSGGKDSLTLLWFLKERLKWIPINYELLALHIDLGFKDESNDKLISFFEENEIRYKIVKTDIGPKAHSEINKKNPCFFCSRQRRKLIFEIADELGYSKIAYGHHKDDVIETLFLNIFYGANISTMLPVQEFFDNRFKIIRPLYLVDEILIEKFFKSKGWTEKESGCPTSFSSKRKDIKDLLQGIYKTDKRIKENIFHAIHNLRPEYLPSSLLLHKGI